MILDLSLAAFALAMAVLGWSRGLWSQVAGLVALFALWVGFDLWFPPLDAHIAGIGPAFAEHPFARKLVGFVLGWFGAVLVLALLEWGVLRRFELLDAGNSVLGAIVGLLKGLLYAACLCWIVVTLDAWGRKPGAPAAPWIAESRVVATVGPFNPLYVYALKERVLAGVAVGTRMRARVGADGGDKFAAAPTSAGEGPGAAGAPPAGAAGARPKAGGQGSPGDLTSTGGAEPGVAAESGKPPPGTPIEEDRRAWALLRKSPIGGLIDETATASEWEGRGYGDLVMDPKVREVLGDSDLAELFFGED